MFPKVSGRCIQHRVCSLECIHRLTPRKPLPRLRMPTFSHIVEWLLLMIKMGYSAIVDRIDRFLNLKKGGIDLVIVGHADHWSNRGALKYNLDFSDGRKNGIQCLIQMTQCYPR